MKMQGYSLLELLLTVAIAAILLFLGTAGFGRSVAESRMRAEMNGLFHAVHLARKESIMRRRVVSICSSVDGDRCSGTLDWSAGWIVFENRDRDEPPVRDAGEALLSRHSASDQIRIDGNRKGFTLRSVDLRATNGTLIVCDRSRRAASRALVISYTGRPRVARRNRRGQPYACRD